MSCGRVALFVVAITALAIVMTSLSRGDRLATVVVLVNSTVEEPPAVAAAAVELAVPDPPLTNGSPNESPNGSPNESSLQCELRWRPSSFERPLWSLDRYAHQHAGCPPRSFIECTGKRLRRALVIYMLHTRPSPHDMQPEMWNLRYFHDFAVLEENQSTNIFEGVDYVFTRMVPPGLGGIGSLPATCAQGGNIRLLWLPNGPCDLCAHHRTIQYLGGVAAVAEQYSYLVYMNAATRGPFQHADDPAWIDIFAMAGQQRTEGGALPRVMTGPTISRDNVGIHVQSYMVGLPTTILPLVDPYLDKCAGDKLHCIYGGEVAVGEEALRRNVWIHSLSRNITVKTWDESNAYQNVHRSHNPRFGNPIETPVDGCASVFVKHGGTFLRAVPEEVAAQLAQLTIHQSDRRRTDGAARIRNLTKMQQCPFWRL